MARRSCLRLAVLLALFLALLPAVAAAAPPERPSRPAVDAGILADLWQALVSLVSPLGSIMDPDGATSPPPPPAEDRSELGSTMDPNG
jgi:hypothetical protein